MTTEMRDMLSNELQEALEKDDLKDAIKVLLRANEALVDCQCKTANRVKVLAQNQSTARIILRFIVYLATASGGAGILKLIQLASQ